MASERLFVPMLELSPLMDSANPESVLEVGASDLRNHFEARYGAGTPTNPRSRFAARQVLERVTEFSTSDTLLSDDIYKFLPNWLHLMEPLFQSNHTLGKIVNNQLTSREQPNKSAAPADRGDILYCASLFDTISVAIAGELQVIPVDRDGRNHAALLIEQGITVKSDAARARDAETVKFIVNSDMFNIGQRKKLVRLQQKAAEEVGLSSQYLRRLQQVLPSMVFDELNVIDQHSLSPQKPSTN